MTGMYIFAIVLLMATVLYYNTLRILCGVLPVLD